MNAVMSEKKIFDSMMELARKETTEIEDKSKFLLGLNWVKENTEIEFSIDPDADKLTLTRGFDKVSLQVKEIDANQISVSYSLVESFHDYIEGLKNFDIYAH